jgi:hypothetical protein
MGAFSDQRKRTVASRSQDRPRTALVRHQLPSYETEGHRFKSCRARFTLPRLWSQNWLYRRDCHAN